MYNLPIYRCIHRKEDVGKINCQCGGIQTVFKCELHELCMIRKLKPGIPKIEYKDGTKESRELSYCNMCEDIQ